MIDIKEFRKVNNLTQVQLADYLNVSKGYISQVESGKCSLSSGKLKELQSNDRGWDASTLYEGEPKKQDEVVTLATLAAELAELRKVIEEQQGSLISIINRLTQ